MPGLDDTRDAAFGVALAEAVDLTDSEMEGVIAVLVRAAPDGLSVDEIHARLNSVLPTMREYKLHAAIFELITGGDDLLAIWPDDSGEIRMRVVGEPTGAGP